MICLGAQARRESRGSLQAQEAGAESIRRTPLKIAGKCRGCLSDGTAGNTCRARYTAEARKRSPTPMRLLVPPVNSPQL